MYLINQRLKSALTKNAAQITPPNKIAKFTESTGTTKDLIWDKKGESINLGSTIKVTSEPIRDIPIRSSKEEKEKRRIKKGIFFFSFPRIAKSLEIIFWFNLNFFLGYRTRQFENSKPSSYYKSSL